ncbi:probable LRR receptor-like serine/threonine-protein kinase At3g47570 [Brachypodium distachyon]|uniref:probable LRR receptor-like serine/threonine-protein kinase At3g47570 n=1 Tax=Brachypodium distachyon TaxID=15368 RepID=UPI00071C40CE|nr:probable LRR receptor-like serine/threonine-protein kinase At3g47570 [Brachypodium distachyon]|eukprot:XP_014751128.1 probable LRR receptor-like serine/threonine-protein kinase At3g47570 [Brachypodium distachyon]
MLNGSIPQSFSNLKSIDQVDLSQNYLVGQIPEFFASMIFLQQLDLSTNYFEGPILTGGIFRNNSAAILHGNTHLCERATTTLFQFPICSTPSADESKINALLLVKIIAPIAIALLSFICFVATLLKRRQAHIAPCYKETMKKVSYGDIIKATNWLSPVNKISSSRTSSIFIGRFEFDTDLVAIKLFHLEENGARNSFLTECEVLRNTRHRNIVKAVTVCSTVDLENNEFKAIVFDFMANGSLDMWVHPKLHQNSPKRLLTLGQRLRIAADVALALDYMHNQLTPPLIHCDLKPGNVLLDYDMTARVGDVGSARFLSSSPGSPEDLVGVEGTIGYIAPEYGMGYKVSTGCDVYGFGVLLLEMLTGRRPTDAMFTDGMSLHKLVSSAFPGHMISRWLRLLKMMPGKSRCSLSQNKGVDVEYWSFLSR